MSLNGAEQPRWIDEVADLFGKPTYSLISSVEEPSLDEVAVYHVRLANSDPQIPLSDANTLAITMMHNKFEDSFRVDVRNPQENNVYAAGVTYKIADSKDQLNFYTESEETGLQLLFSVLSRGEITPDFQLIKN